MKVIFGEMTSGHWKGGPLINSSISKTEVTSKLRVAHLIAIGGTKTPGCLYEVAVSKGVAHVHEPAQLSPGKSGLSK